jgi:hypothetical protein
MATTAPLTASCLQVGSDRTGRRSFASPILLGLLAAAGIGLAKGAVAYARRSSVPEPHVPGTNAGVVHICIGVTFFILILLVEVRRRRRGLPSPWVAPFTPGAWSRLRTTFTEGGFATLPRLLVVVPTVIVMLYCPWRMGAQIIGGLDHNSTVNAWGGPSYVGAMLAHWLDCVVAFYAGAGILHLSLRRVNGLRSVGE